MSTVKEQAHVLQNMVRRLEHSDSAPGGAVRIAPDGSITPLLTSCDNSAWVWVKDGKPYVHLPGVPRTWVDPTPDEIRNDGYTELGIVELIFRWWLIIRREEPTSDVAKVFDLATKLINDHIEEGYAYWGSDYGYGTIELKASVPGYAGAVYVREDKSTFDAVRAAATLVRTIKSHFVGDSLATVLGDLGEILYAEIPDSQDSGIQDP